MPHGQPPRPRVERRVPDPDTRSTGVRRVADTRGMRSRRAQRAKRSRLRPSPCRGVSRRHGRLRMSMHRSAVPAAVGCSQTPSCRSPMTRPCSSCPESHCCQRSGGFFRRTVGLRGTNVWCRERRILLSRPRRGAREPSVDEDELRRRADAGWAPRAPPRRCGESVRCETLASRRSEPPRRFWGGAGSVECEAS